MLGRAQETPSLSSPLPTRVDGALSRVRVGINSDADVACRACSSTAETTNKLLLQFEGVACKAARAAWCASVLQRACKAPSLASDIEIFFADVERLRRTSGGTLRG